MSVENVKPPTRNPDKIQLNFDVSKDLYGRIDAEATRLGIPKAGFMRQLAVKYFDDGETDDKTQSNRKNTYLKPNRHETNQN